MIDYKECAKTNCTNEKNWNINEFHRAEGIVRLRICLCADCIKTFESNTTPSSNYTPYIDLKMATKKGK